MQRITRYMDQYYIDGIVGFIPGGIGDGVAALFSIVHVYFSMFRLRSIPLTLAILNNTLRDILLGMIPFCIGDVIDFFHRANTKNMALINGFIEDDPDILHEVNHKALQSLLVFILLVAAIFILVTVLIWMTRKLELVFFS